MLPELTVGDATVTEGDAGTKDATFTVNLSGASDEEVTVDYVTEDGTATGAFADADPGSGFVTRAGAQLSLDGVPYRFSGLNAYNLNSDGLCWYSYNAGQLDDSLAAIGAMGGKSVLRAWFFQDLATTAGARDWTAFDRTLDRARAQGFKVIATLGNHWADCDHGLRPQGPGLVRDRLHDRRPGRHRFVPRLGRRDRRPVQGRPGDPDVGADQRAGDEQRRRRRAARARRPRSRPSWPTSAA